MATIKFSEGGELSEVMVTFICWREGCKNFSCSYSVDELIDCGYPFCHNCGNSMAVVTEITATKGYVNP